MRAPRRKEMAQGVRQMRTLGAKFMKKLRWAWTSQLQRLSNIKFASFVFEELRSCMTMYANTMVDGITVFG